MTNYANTFSGAAKDAAEAVVLGAAHDTQYDGIATMSATKANKIASATNGNLISQDAGGDLVDSTILASDLSSWAALPTETMVIKSIDEDVTSSTTLQDDDELTVTLAANSVYRLESWIEFTSAHTSPNIDVQWSEADGTWSGITVEAQPGTITGTVWASETTAKIAIGIDANDNSFLRTDGMIRTGGAGGAFTFTWAQNSSHATPTTVLAGSWLRVTLLA